MVVFNLRRIKNVSLNHTPHKRHFKISSKHLPLGVQFFAATSLSPAHNCRLFYDAKTEI